MRLIDADALKPSYIDSLCRFYVSIKDINSAPTVDAVEVVRCKDCKEFETIGYCLFWGDDMGDNGYCSYGERKY